MLYDAHVHIGMFPDVTETVTCALNQNIVPVCVSTSISECSELLNVLDKNSIKIPVFLGVHPWYLKDHSFNREQAVKLLSYDCVSGAGEFGLDSRCDVPLKTQIECLNEQLLFAVEYSLPVNLHIRSCHGELIRELKKFRGAVTGIVHNFTFSYEIAKEYLNLGLTLSVGHHICNEHSSKLCEVIKKTGLNHIVLESDQDYIHTGNYDPNVILKSYRRAGEIFKMSPQRVELTIENNLMSILGKTDEPGIYC